MKTNRNQQNVIATFMSGVKTARKGGIALTQEKSADIALTTIGTMFKDDGNPIELPAPQADILKVLFYPKNSTRMRVIKSTLKSVGCTLDETTEELLNRLLTPALLEKKLAKVQTAPPAINWNEMVDDEENLSSSVDQDEPATGADNDGAAEEEVAPAEEPPTAVSPTKPTKPKDR